MCLALAKVKLSRTLLGRAHWLGRGEEEGDPDRSLAALFCAFPTHPLAPPSTRNTPTHCHRVAGWEVRNSMGALSLILPCPFPCSTWVGCHADTCLEYSERMDASRACLLPVAQRMAREGQALLNQHSGPCNSIPSDNSQDTGRVVAPGLAWAPGGK